ncbi:MAG TPA: methyltransferase domain-containing protein [Casimicrobiaceae bacterium]|nr:methyltransferase domain-containing protein [Casimicrobiaceae bacterium]
MTSLQADLGHLGPGGAAAPAVAGLRALGRGDRRAAELALAACPSSPPKDADALHSIGVLAVLLGHHKRGAELLTAAVDLAPQRPDLRCHLAVALRRLGENAIAIGHLEAALRLDPSLAEAHSGLGNLLLDRAEYAVARRHFERALALHAAIPDALNGLGNCDLALGFPERACASYERALALEPTFHEAWYNLSCARLQCGGEAPDADKRLALQSIVTALRFAPDSPADWIQFEACVRDLDLRHPADPPLRQALQAALGHPSVDPMRLVRPVVGLVLSAPGLDSALAALGAGSPSAVGEPQLRDAVRSVLADPLLLRLLEAVVIAREPVQRIVAFARGRLLADRLSRMRGEPFLPLESVIAAAHQHFNTEYVNEETDVEREGVARLVAEVTESARAGGPPALHDVALLACYRPLGSLADVARAAAGLTATPLASLLRRQIEEPRAEASLRKSIESLTPVLDGVSNAVRMQYEANPYPRWQRARREPAFGSLAQYLRRLFPRGDLAGIAPPPEQILVAGCGTGLHPVQTALRFPAASVLAVDLSLASLAHAERKTREMGIANVAYRQADLLALGSLDRRFDAVECIGVLHHLRDPMAGWRVLRSLLRPGGLMRVGLYSAAARRHVARAREFAKAEGFDASPEGIRRFRVATRARSDDPLLERVAGDFDFYSESGCRDLVFNVQETAFTLPTIAAALEELGLAFLGFDMPDSMRAAYRARHPDDSALTDLAHWAAFEDEHPDTFAAMYQFWVRVPATKID